MDPYVRETISKDAIGTNELQTPQKSEAEIHNDQLVELGWKSQSLESVANSLLESATRLEKEIESETRHWAQVLKIKSQGWSITRLPREEHTLGVRFSFAEGRYHIRRTVKRDSDQHTAHPDFRDRGIAALRRDEDGDISLDRDPQYTGDQSLRVRMLQHGTILGSSRNFTSTIKKQDDDMDEDSIEDQILQARDSLFDEELHAEIHREARNLTNQGVSCMEDVVQLPFEADKVIQIDLVDCNDTGDDPDLHGDDTIPTAISVALHVLLSRAHRQNVSRRSRPPAPLTNSKAPRPVYQILKPIVEHMRHRADLDSWHDYIVDITKTMARGGLEIEMQEDSKELLNIPGSLADIVQEDESTTDVIIRSLTVPPRSSCTLRLPWGQSILKIEAVTNLFPPLFGTNYRCIIESSMPDSVMATLPHTVQVKSFLDLQTHLKHILTVDTIDLITRISAGWTIVDPHTGILSRNHRKSPDELESLSICFAIEAKKLTLEWIRRVESDEFDLETPRSLKRTVIWAEGTDGGKSVLDTVKDLASRND